MHDAAVVGSHKLMGYFREQEKLPARSIRKSLLINSTNGSSPARPQYHGYNTNETTDFKKRFG